MALNLTTLTSPITATDLSFPVASVTGASVGRIVRINNEMMGAVLAVKSLTVFVRGRGWDGTSGRIQGVGSPVVFGDGVDFPPIAEAREVAVPPRKAEQVSYGTNDAILVPEKDTTVLLTKATAGAYTLAAPPVGQDGIVITFISTTAAAHVVTATALYQDGVTGGAKNAATFAAFVGAAMIVQSLKGTWTVVSLKGVTVA